MKGLSGFWKHWNEAIRRNRSHYKPSFPPRSGLMYDPTFVGASFRPGERVNPLAATIEE